jgi:3-phytase
MEALRRIWGQCLVVGLVLLGAIPAISAAIPAQTLNAEPVQPRVVTTVAKHDTDDPAIWINRANLAESLVLGTDKDADGALLVYGLDGIEKKDRSVRGILRPNNVDLAYDIALGEGLADVVVVAERLAHRLRVYRLPDMVPVDGGGISVFEGERARDVMGVALYRRPHDGALFAIVSRSDFGAPRQGYLHQYRLVDDGTGQLRGVFVRAFGDWSGLKEIEALAVDSEQGFVYASDETYGVRKYLADPAAEDAEDELTVIGREGFARDHEGISIYPTGAKTGFILVSDQQADTFRVFRREGTATDPHAHELVGAVKLSTDESDGSDVTAVELPGFPGGLFVAMSTDRTFQFYAWDDIAKAAKLSP